MEKVSRETPRHQDLLRGRAAVIAQGIEVPDDVCREHARSSQLEWLETDGLGGYAMGTVAGTHTRRYHGLLVAALRPPTGRHLLLSRLEEAVVGADGGETALATNQYPGTLHPQGFRRLAGFRLDPFPTWTFRVGDVEITKRVLMVRGRSAVVVRYGASRLVRLRVRPFLAFRDHHALVRENDALDARVREVACHGARTLAVRPYRGLPELVLHHSGGRFTADGAWHRDTEYLAELERGLEFREDLWRMGTIAMDVRPGEDAFVVATTGPWPELTVETIDALEAAEVGRRAAANPLPRATGGGRERELDRLRALLHGAADRFVVTREDGSPTVIAGYPWFTDWGRDTMIALPGLLVARGLLDQAREVIRGFLAHLSGGLIPNLFPDRGQAPEYNTADATLWLFQAVQAYLAAGGDPSFAREVYPHAREIVGQHRMGTLHGIRVDPGDGLLVAGGAGTQLTWMDAKVGDWVVTPRHGKPVEVNALWYNALRLAATWARTSHDFPGAAELERDASRVAQAFDRAYWNPERSCLFDVLLPEGPDARIRPNQIFAVALPFPLLELGQRQEVVRAVERHLLTPAGLRTLAPSDPDYRPHYAGPPRERDGAYHQGAVWPWLLGPYVRAYLAAFGRSAGAVAHCRSLLAGLERHLVGEGCLGAVSEILEPEPPFRPVGAPAQAWSVAEPLAVIEGELAGATASTSPPRTSSSHASHAVAAP
jgi:predicted glycogen debranching enzyme